jgi:hypothetical protein
MAQCPGNPCGGRRQKKKKKKRRVREQGERRREVSCPAIPSRRPPEEPIQGSEHQALRSSRACVRLGYARSREICALAPRGAQSAHPLGLCATVQAGRWKGWLAGAGGLIGRAIPPVRQPPVDEVGSSGDPGNSQPAFCAGKEESIRDSTAPAGTVKTARAVEGKEALTGTTRTPGPGRVPATVIRAPHSTDNFSRWHPVDRRIDHSGSVRRWHA